MNLNLNQTDRPRSIRKSLFSLLGASILVIILLTSATVLMFVYQTEREAWRGRQEEASLRAAETISSFLREIEIHLSSAAIVETEYLDNHPQTMASFLEGNAAIMEIVRLDEQGVVLAGASKRNPLLTNLFTIEQSVWFTVASEGRRYLTDVQLSSIDEPYLIMAIPAPDRGVIAARVSMKVLWAVVGNIRFGETGSAYIISEEGKIVGHTDGQIPLANISLAGRPEMSAIRAAPDYAWHGVYVDFAGVSVVGTTARIPNTNWVIVTELPRAEATAESRAAWTVLVGGMLLIAALVNIAMGPFLQRLILQPMENLRAGAQRIGQGDLDYRIDSLRNDEVGQVARAFNEMARILRQRDRQLAGKTDSLVAEVAERKTAQEALKQAHDHLELHVAERTKELAQANHALQVEIMERERVENRIRESLDEKVVLLKEIHHRVKNNLQVIASMLNLQSAHVEDEKTLEMLLASQSRVEAMAAIHEKLYRSKNLAKIDFADYIRDLTASLVSTYGNPESSIDLSLEADEAWLTVDVSVPCGLILNELVSNALKYAFPDQNGGQIWIRFIKGPDGQLSLSVADNGVGFPAELDFQNTESLGLQLVNTLANQLEGSCELHNGQGAEFRLTFPAPSQGITS